MAEKEIEYTIQVDNNISTDDQEIRIAFYSNIGFFIEVTQMLEYNLRKLLCYHKSVTEIEEGDLTKERVETICKKYDDYYSKTYEEKYTLGKLTNQLNCIKQLDKKVLKIFTEINDYRILVVHKLFQINVVVDKLRDSKNVLEYTNERLLPMTNKTKSVNDMVINIINAYKENLHTYKDQVGIEYEK